MTTKTHLETALKIISRHDIGEVRQNIITSHLSFHSTIVCNPGDILKHFCAGTTQHFATYLTIQVGKNKHITFDPVYLQYINHSCDPNVFFNTTTMQMVCLKAILPGDELGFFYPSTEWEMVQSFICHCGNSNCLQYINGAAHIHTDTLRKYRLTDFILQQINQQA